MKNILRVHLKNKERPMIKKILNLIKPKATNLEWFEKYENCLGELATTDRQIDERKQGWTYGQEIARFQRGS